MGTSADRWGFGLLIAAILSALALSLPALQGQALALDEHVSYFCSGASSLGELWMRCDEVAVLPPLSHLLERAALALGGKTESVFRLPSLIAYALAVPAGWWLGRLAGGPVCGGLTALIIAWHPGMVDEVRFARCYGLVLLLASLSTAFLFRWRSEPDGRRWLAGWAVTAAALCWTHYLAAPLVVAQSIALFAIASRFSFPRRNRALSSAVIAVAAAALACTPIMPAVLRLREWSSFIEFQRSPATVSQAFGAAWTIPALALLALSQVWILVRKRRTEGPQTPIWIPLFLWLLPLALIGCQGLWESPMLASPRYRVLIVPASAVAVGLALSRAFRPLVACGMAAGLLAMSAHSHGFSPARPSRLANQVEEEWKRIGLELAPHMSDPGLLVFTQTGLAEGFLLPLMPGYQPLKTYVSCRLGGFYTGSEAARPIPILWDVNGPLKRDYLALLDAPGLREVRIVGANDTDLNANSVDVFAAWLRSIGFQQSASESRPGITLLTFRPANRPPGPTGPTETR